MAPLLVAVTLCAASMVVLVLTLRLVERASDAQPHPDGLREIRADLYGLREDTAALAAEVARRVDR